MPTLSTDVTGVGRPPTLAICIVVVAGRFRLTTGFVLVLLSRLVLGGTR